MPRTCYIIYNSLPKEEKSRLSGFRGGCRAQQPRPGLRERPSAHLRLPGQLVTASEMRRPRASRQVLSPQPEGHSGPFFMSFSLSGTPRPELMFVKAIDVEHFCAQGILRLSPLSAISRVQIFAHL